MVIMFALEFRISRTFLKELLICRIQVVNGICQGELIHIFQPLIFFYFSDELDAQIFYNKYRTNVYRSDCI